ncbi:class I SAM-dependent methyltransferase [Nocardia sp. CA2R105]|uniref:class I SAM-dependent methyltransferase n=1 Tax=Nocardia coffeae TaxID=2873381 RepID=UPI001CA71EEB|nr:class I SAM-dependent methyltransferase [Nocardia coffeae]MBY8862252.1 class I SAM-dependent methyltransferase [Nocardia coffeae]
MTVATPMLGAIRSCDELPDEFFTQFLDPTRTYSCALWTHPDDTLEQAQFAKIDLALDKCDLRPGMTLLDVGCGWGSTMLRAMDDYGVNAIGLTGNRHQYRYVRDQLVDRLIRGHPYGGVRRQGWEELGRRPDRIVCIGRLEHFHSKRYPDFFDFAYRTLPEDGVLLVQTVVAPDRSDTDQTRVAAADSTAPETIFPVDRLLPPTGHNPKGVTEYAEDAGFTITRLERLGQHYTTTLQCWTSALHEHRDRAIDLAGPDTYNAYISSMTGCADHFRSGQLDVVQFTCTKLAAPHQPVPRSLPRDIPATVIAEPA